MPAQKWEFLNFDILPQEQDEASRKLARASAARAYRRTERQQKVEMFQKAKMAGQVPNGGPQPISGTTGSFQSSNHLNTGTAISHPDARPREQLPSLQEVDVRPNSLDIFWGLTDLRSLDPSGTQSMGLNQSQHYLLNHFLSIMAPKPFRFTTRREESPLRFSWMHRALQDPIMLEATLLNAAAHLDILYKRESSPLTLRHRGETIKMVNLTLDSPERASDSTIGAVALLAWSGNYNCNLAEMRIHMDALVALVRLRGGLELLGFGGILHMFITRLDLIFAALTMSEPKFPFVGINPTPKTLVSQETLHSDLHFLERVAPVLGNIPAIFREIRSLAGMQDGFGTDEVPQASIIRFGKKRSSIWHSLLSCSAPATQMDGPQGLASLFEPCKIAALIFMEYVLSNRRPRSEILQSFESQLMRSLQGALERPGIQEAWAGDLLCARIIIWVYFIGGLTASSTLTLQWYASRVGGCIVSLGFITWQELKPCLVDMIWTEKLQDQACEKLCGEIEMALATNGQQLGKRCLDGQFFSTSVVASPQ